MDTLQIRLFGRLSIQRGESERCASLPPKVQELLAYLLLHRERWHTRERLADQLWPEANPLEARARLRRLMWRLRDGLGEDARGGKHLLRVQADWIGINPEADLWLDVAVLEDAERGLTTSAALTIAQALTLQGAIDLVRGDLLESWYQEWCVTERERLRIMQLSMLGRLMEYHVVTGDIERGLAAAASMLQIDRAHEGAHYQLMRLRYLAGDRTGALRQFDLCKHLLEDDLAVTPARRTVALYDDIRREALSTEGAPGAMPAAGSGATRPATDELNARIDRFQAAVLESQHELWRELRALRGTILNEST